MSLCRSGAKIGKIDYEGGNFEAHKAEAEIGIQSPDAIGNVEAYRAKCRTCSVY